MPFSNEELEHLLKLALAEIRRCSVVQSVDYTVSVCQSGPGVSPSSTTLDTKSPETPTDVSAGEITVSVWLETYNQIVLTRGYQDQTLKNKRANLKHVLTLWGSYEVKALKPFHVAQAIKVLSPSLAVRVLSELRDVYVEAIANGVADSNPVAGVKPPKHPGLRQRLSLETWKAMLLLSKTSPQKWVESLLLLAMVTGQRRADLAKMKFSDVVTDSSGAQFLRVEQQKKAGKPVGARVEIPLSLRLDFLGVTVADVIEHCRSSAQPGDTLLRKSGGGPIEMSSLSARFHEHLVAVEGKEVYAEYTAPSLHEVRSLSARTYIAQGLTHLQVQTLLGHTNSEMTDLYLDDRGLSSGVWKKVDLTDRN